LRNAYPRAVTAAGNTVAQQALSDVFAVTDRQWRGIGMIGKSGWTLSPRYAGFDAELKFGVGQLTVAESAECHAGEVLQGLLKPNECPAFGKSCTPRTPLGATMVSSEGACAAYYHFRRLESSASV
jgi:hydrogenase expression/formation protein HypD